MLVSVVSPLVFEFALFVCVFVCSFNAIFLQYRKHLLNNSV